MAVVIPTYNRPLWVLSTIEGVLAQQAPFLTEIIVIDQSEEVPDTVAHILENHDQQKRIRWIRSRIPHPSHARNQALLLTSADIILFLDDDVILRPDLLQRHYAYYTSDASREVTGVTGQLHTRLPQTAPESLTLHNYPANTTPIQPDRILEIAPPSCHPILASCNTSVRRQNVLAIGGFDENLCFNEDRDLTFRLHATGNARLVYDPEAWIIHIRAPEGGCRTAGTRPRTETDRQIPSILFLLRHYRVLDRTWRWQMLKDSLRCGPLRRENVVRFWRQPMAWICFARAVSRAWHERDRIRSVIKGNSYYPEKS